MDMLRSGKMLISEKLNKESDEEIIKPEYEEEIEIESDTEIEIKKVDYKSVDLNEIPKYQRGFLKRCDFNNEKAWFGFHLFRFRKSG